MTQKIYKRFPIHTATACQLKWSHSTVFLTELKTASCHRVNHNSFDLDTFDFHNTPEKIRDRNLMLQGQWPKNGCEHCKDIEDAGGTSDRMIHLNFHGFRAPPELESNPSATKVTPRVLEIYFSNTCNLKCIYCVPAFSSQINQENKIHGPFNNNGVSIPAYEPLPEDYPLAQSKMFSWLDQNIDSLDKILVLGGEPFIQKQSQQLFEYIKTKSLPNLDLVIFSNLTIDHEKFKEQISLLKTLQLTSKLNQINIIGSIDCWGEPAKYVRNGLDLDLFEKNFNYLLHQTDFVLNINSTLSCLTIQSLPELIQKINHWSSHRIIYWSFMKVGGRQYLHPSIFGPQILDLGFTKALNEYQTFNDPEKIAYLDYFKGIEKELSVSVPNVDKQRQLKTYLVELDRRRNTDYTVIFPEISKLLQDINI